jgi:lipopolysaccharide/colanic/teichoic acid biosynthesis glycosyltransferase
VLIVFGFPLLVLIAGLVRLSSPGPVLFVQERVGRHGQHFSMYKFRSMTVPPQGYEATGWGETEQARITAVGKFLRDYGLDELPQVFNILRGEMSIVGPRPPLPRRARDYSERQRKVFQVLPGVLAPGAYQGRRSIPMEERIELHVQYVENWSLWLDLVVLLRCIPVILRRQNVDELALAQNSGSADTHGKKVS